VVSLWCVLCQQTWDRAFDLFGLNVAEPLHGTAAQARQGDNYPTIGMPERRRLGIQFLSQVFDDLPSLPPYYLQPYVAPLFQVAPILIILIIDI
jgi:hypothetical protein